MTVRRRLHRGDNVILGPGQPVGRVDHRTDNLVYVKWPGHTSVTIHDEAHLVRVDTPE